MITIDIASVVNFIVQVIGFGIVIFAVISILGFIFYKGN